MQSHPFFRRRRRRGNQSRISGTSARWRLNSRRVEGRRQFDSGPQVVRLDQGELVAHVVAYSSVLCHHGRRDHVLNYWAGILLLKGDI